VITPCYNSADYIGETIASVAAQSYRPIEHIVVDDASTDESWAIVQSRGDAVHALRQPRNLGASAARNRGASLARGEFFMFLDADDVLGARTIETLVHTLRSEPEHIGVAPWQRLVRSGTEWCTEPADRPLPPAEGDQLMGWLHGRWVPPCAVLWPRSVYEANGGWDESLTLNDDGDLMMRALARGRRLAIARDGQAFYRAHGDDRLSVSKNVFAERHLRSQQRVFTKLAAELERTGRLGAYRTIIGTALRSLALTCHQLGVVDLSRECAAMADALGGRKVVSRTRGGRVLTWLLGVERKERLVEALARFGLATRERRRFTTRRRAHGDRRDR
jgi:glycosyltransferase involved in cell wall biosynthesis